MRMATLVSSCRVMILLERLFQDAQEQAHPSTWATVVACTCERQLAIPVKLQREQPPSTNCNPPLMWHSNERKGDGVFRSSSGSTGYLLGQAVVHTHVLGSSSSLIRGNVDEHECGKIHVVLSFRAICVRVQSIMYVMEAQ